MACHIIWSPRAADQLEGICEYIAEDSPDYARAFAQKVVSVVRSIPSFTQAGRIVPEYGNAMLREKIYGNYRIVYRLSSNSATIEIVAICHAAQQLPRILSEGDA